VESVHHAGILLARLRKTTKILAADTSLRAEMREPGVITIHLRISVTDFVKQRSR
jgi:hypothetical protein